MRRKPRSRDEDLNTAFHEAGHAVAHVYLGVPLRKVTIEATADAAGYVLGTWLRSDDFLKMVPLSGRWLRWKNRAENEIVTALCGGVAQRKHNRSLSKSHHGSSDRRIAVDIAIQVLGRPTRNTLEAYLEFKHAEATQLVADRWREIRAVAAALVERGSLTRREVVDVIDNSLGLSPLRIKESGESR